MDSDQNQHALESTISSQDFSLIWGPTSGTERFRGAASTSDFREAPTLQIQKPTTTTKLFEQTEGCRNPLNSVPEIDPSFLTRFVLFGAEVTVSLVFQFVLDFIQANELTNGNFEPDRNSSVIRGGVFDETRFVEYQIKMFTTQGRLGLTLDILDGFAPAIQEFWKELQRALQENEFSEQLVESDSEDWDFLESDDEDVDFDLLSDAKFLKLGDSPEIVHQWFEDLSNPTFMQQTLLLLAWNCQDAQNFQVVTDEKQAQKLFDTIIACMFATATDFCLPIARCASLLVSQLVESHDIKITKEQFDVLVQTLVQWSISNQAENESKLTSSQEVASILSSQMSKMATFAANWKDTLEQVYTQAPYDCVRENLHEVIRAY